MKKDDLRVAYQDKRKKAKTLSETIFPEKAVRLSTIDPISLASST